MLPPSRAIIFNIEGWWQASPVRHFWPLKMIICDPACGGIPAGDELRHQSFDETCRAK
jgi:hypothetical protein